MAAWATPCNLDLGPDIQQHLSTCVYSRTESFLKQAQVNMLQLTPLHHRHPKGLGIDHRHQVALVVPILMTGGGGLLRLSGKAQFLQGGHKCLLICAGVSFTTGYPPGIMGKVFAFLMDITR